MAFHEGHDWKATSPEWYQAAPSLVISLRYHVRNTWQGRFATIWLVSKWGLWAPVPARVGARNHPHPYKRCAVRGTPGDNGIAKQRLDSWCDGTIRNEKDTAIDLTCKPDHVRSLSFDIAKWVRTFGCSPRRRWQLEPRKMIYGKRQTNSS